MLEKDMVNDALSSINSSLTDYAGIIAQSANQQFRQAVAQMRNNCENFQYELFKLAEQKGFYKSAAPADPNDIQQVRSQFVS